MSTEPPEPPEKKESDFRAGWRHGATARRNGHPHPTFAAVEAALSEPDEKFHRDVRAGSHLMLSWLPRADRKVAAVQLQVIAMSAQMRQWRITYQALLFGRTTCVCAIVPSILLLLCGEPVYVSWLGAACAVTFGGAAYFIHAWRVYLEGEIEVAWDAVHDTEQALVAEHEAAVSREKAAHDGRWHPPAAIDVPSDGEDDDE